MLLLHGALFVLSTRSIYLLLRAIWIVHFSIIVIVIDQLLRISSELLGLTTADLSW
jgi:hypothetical protein